VKSAFVKSLKIGEVVLKNNIALAPLAGFTDIAFRRLCKECGAGLTATEMVSVNGLKYGNEKTEILLRRFDGENPSCVQLFGSDPNAFKDALSMTEELAAFDVIDINMGCPMPKVTKTGAGSALLEDCARAAEIVRATAESANGRPVTVKMRLGKEDSKNAEHFAEEMERAGATMLTVHGRTVRQLYSGVADWKAIARVKASVKIPVFGNGDVTSKKDFETAVAESGVDGVALGRGALGNPALFGEILGYETLEKREAAVLHATYMSKYFSESYAVANFRKHAAHYLKGIQGARRIKSRLMSEKSFSAVIDLLKEI
jgi:nifR3 family TIM-barrel protein